jgi:hypothetical protein
VTLLSQLPGVAAVVAWLALVAGLALVVRARWPEQREWSRKLVHIETEAEIIVEPRPDFQLEHFKEGVDHLSAA